MNDLHYLSQNTAAAEPAVIAFEEREWRLWPLDTIGIAAQLERFVVQFVRAQVEKLRPGDDDDDPMSWRIYREDKAEAQEAIQRGRYGTMTNGWSDILCNTETGFREAIYQCLRFKNPNWTREHVQRLLANDERFKIVRDMFLELNFPKVHSPALTGQQSATSPKNGPSVGTGSLPVPCCEASSPANLNASASGS